MSIRYRRNIDCLSGDGLHDLREAMQALYDLPETMGDSFATLGGLHGSPSPGWCDHGTPGFLTWHRAYMRSFEKALQCVNSDLMLPFWDWSSRDTIGLPAACTDPTYVNRAGDAAPNPLYSGPIAVAAGGGNTTRRDDVDTLSFSGSATAARAALSSLDFASFQNALNGPHGSVHVTVGGDMGSVSFAGFDPVFYLHHANVDRLWWNWQRTHPSTSMPTSEMGHPLDPFNKAFSDEWYVGSDVESTDDLGYRYRNWCFWIPPVLVWEVAVLKIEPWIIPRLANARIIMRSNRMASESVEFRVFINQPDADATTPIEDNPSFAGSIGTFGMGPTKTEMRSTSRAFDLELNVTECLKSCHREGDGEVEFKILALSPEGEAIGAQRTDIQSIDLTLD